jgi:hypothetical protein
VVIARCNAKNGDIFKIVRQNSEFSYQVPFDGKLHNLKQRGDLSDIGIGQIEPLRRFLEDVEPEVFDKIVNDTHGNLRWAKRSLEESRERLERCAAEGVLGQRDSQEQAGASGNAGGRGADLS